MYLMKIKGIAKIPDFLQIRDDNFTLIGYMKLDNVSQGIKRIGLEKEEDKIRRALDKAPFGKIIELNK